MKAFFKAQASSLLATAVDFITTAGFVELANWHYTLAVIMGAVAGALANFLINRYWAFDAGAQSARQQGYRYALVWLGSLLLNVCGVYVFTRFLKLHYLFAKMLVATMVGLGFNYLLQKEYVFNTNEKSSS